MADEPMDAPLREDDPDRPAEDAWEEAKADEDPASDEDWLLVAVVAAVDAAEEPSMAEAELPCPVVDVTAPLDRPDEPSPPQRPPRHAWPGGQSCPVLHTMPAGQPHTNASVGISPTQCCRTMHPPIPDAPPPQTRQPWRHCAEAPRAGWSSSR
jgi:hypothetical protein